VRWRVPSRDLETIKELIHGCQKKYPMFENPNYQPTPAEAEEHKKYLALLEYAYPAAVLRQRLSQASDRVTGVSREQKLGAETPLDSATSADRQPKGFRGLGQKQSNLSRYFDAVELTQRQRECASLKLEYGLSDRQIAARLGLHHKTVQESFASAKKRLERNENLKRELKKRASHRGTHDESD
jgi:DNA-binding CsgD family transcriptional regulator